LKENCRKYTEWRRSKTLAMKRDEEIGEETNLRTTDQTREFESTKEVNLNAAEDASEDAAENAAEDASENAAEDASENAAENAAGANSATSASNGTKKSQMKERKNDGGSKVSEVPEMSFGGRTSSNHLVRESQSHVKRPVTFRPSAVVESAAGSPVSGSTSSRGTVFRISKKAPKVLSVDEIFAQAIHEYREQQSESFRSSSFGGGRRKSMRGSAVGTESGAAKRDSHSVRKQIERENEERRWKYDVEKSAASIDRSELMASSSSEDEYLEQTETEESSSTMTQEQIHRRKVQYHLDIAADVFKLFVCFCLALALGAFPLVFLETDNLPEEIRFNISEANVCYWAGSKGFLNPINPCPYRGYISNDRESNECLRWKDAIDGGNGLPGVGVDEIRYSKDFQSYREYLRHWRELYYKRDTLTPERREIVSDYEHRFCRRLGDRPSGNHAVCLTLGEKGRQAKDEIFVKKCWIVPCSIRIASKCYQMQVQAENAKARPEKS